MQKSAGVSAVRSVSRAIRILELLAADGQLSAADVGRRMGLPRSSAFELLSTLEQEGVLEKDRERNLYHLGLKVFELGARAQTNLEIRRVAYPYLKALNQELDETVHLTVLDDREVLYVECVESTKRLRTYSVLGVRAHLHCTAVGKAILAFLPPDEVEDVLREKGLPRFTDHTLTDPGALKADLEVSGVAGTRWTGWSTRRGSAVWVRPSAITRGGCSPPSASRALRSGSPPSASRRSPGRCCGARRRFRASWAGGGPGRSPENPGREGARDATPARRRESATGPCGGPWKKRRNEEKGGARCASSSSSFSP